MVIAPGALLIVPEGATVTTTNTGVWARCEWQLNAPLLRHGQLANHAGKPLRMSTADFSLLAAMTSVISTESTFATAWGGGLLVDSLAAAIATAVFTSTWTSLNLSEAQADTIHNAIQVIYKRHADASFTVAGLAAEISISKHYLHRLFASVGVTPRQILEARRVSTAVAMLKISPNHSVDVMSAVAQKSGFATVRTMQAAIRRQQDMKGPSLR
ncbi:helix-turn-helix domain-containing protein [Microbacterium sp. LWO12-1.2]|uniref:helix-turn-helix domain-containing protein n=1 Tax=Microbacterium sp. LWO12-1.2 TaxID=3135261 RepID=UPI003426128F